MERDSAAADAPSRHQARTRTAHRRPGGAHEDHAADLSATLERNNAAFERLWADMAAWETRLIARLRSCLLWLVLRPTVRPGC